MTPRRPSPSFVLSPGVPVLATLPQDGLAGLLAARDEPLSACHSLAWLTEFATIPENAAPPLAMSGPHPRAVGSYGAECIAWAKRELGLTLRWWQALAITRQLEHDADGALVWREIVESGPRRIGKSVRLRVVALWRLANAERFLEPQLAMLVSKDLAVGKEIHRGSWRWAETKNWNVLRLNGAQEIETPTGDRWLLRAPNAAYGYDVGYGQVDESWGVDPTAITDGLEPALLERQSPQLHLTSTAHVKASSLMRRRLLAALRNADPDVLLLLWGAPPDVDFADEGVWRLSSPHWSKDRRNLMARKYAAALAGQDEPEFDDPDPIRGWAAQYLNVWPLLTTSSSLIMPNWPLCSTTTVPGGPAALGLAMDPDRIWLSCCAATEDEVPHLAPVTSKATNRTLRVRVSDRADRAMFIQEVARIQTARKCAVVADRKGGLDKTGVARDLEEAGVNINWIGLDENIAACADLYDAVEGKEVTHGSYVELDDAMAAAGWRRVGDRRLLARRNGDVSMLEAAALAFWGADNSTPTDDAWGFFS